MPFELRTVPPDPLLVLWVSLVLIILDRALEEVNEPRIGARRGGHRRRSISSVQPIPSSQGMSTTAMLVEVRAAAIRSDSIAVASRR